ncbi:hypothetical protein FGL97_11755 [Pseudomonas putida]|uniref:hypothetical protein n=1 Tax=Pseudomonas putida TaxID=303 RepID=UPI00159D52F2|nr:hypothetical protein [Pseudomonas putida]NVN63885.1 hypothetical protein [Pseudomonas putida]NVN68611.1 hypothetical protein [Pseudomonas putida]
MDIHVINSDWKTEAPDLMGSFHTPCVFADAYASDGLLEILEVRVARGERGILVMDCTRAQVQAVLEWSSCDDDGQLQDLEIFLVRRD